MRSLATRYCCGCRLLANQPTPTSWKADVDYKGGSFCAGGSYIGGGLLQGHYLQSVTESLALGAGPVRAGRSPG